jgi:hypothetical protein
LFGLDDEGHTKSGGDGRIGDTHEGEKIRRLHQRGVEWL